MDQHDLSRPGPDPRTEPLPGGAHPFAVPASTDPADYPQAPPDDGSIPTGILQFSVPTRKQALDRRQQERAGYWMPLHRTGGHAHVRVLSMTDPGTLAGLPMHAQREVLVVFDETNKQSGGGNAPMTIDRITKNQGRQERLANPICLAGFIYPRLYETEADLPSDDPMAMVVTDLHIEERVRYLNLCTGADEALLAQLAPFLADGTS